MNMSGIDPEVILEDDECVILSKPAGLICHSDGRTEEPSVADWLAERYPDMRGVGEPWMSPQGRVVPVNGLAHRLDRTTSGVLVAARTQEMWEYLRREFKERRVEKEYRAIVYGHVKGESGRIVTEIARSSMSPKRWYAKPREEAHVRAAITDWRVLSRGLSPAGEPYSMLAVFPRTGRTHQIRVHLAHVGCPLIADHLYAPERGPILGFDRPALHAYRISFALLRGQRHDVVAPCPDDFPDS